MCGSPDAFRPLIVVLDEDEALRQALRFSLETEGYRVQTFGASADLLGCSHRLGAACFVIDEASCDRRLRGQLRWSKVPVILISAGGARRPTDGDRVRVVEKPLITDALSREIAKALAAG